MAHTAKVREIRNRMIEIYGDYCWMGYTLDKKNPFTFHHIFEQRKGGKDLINNGALLTKDAHNDLNQLDMHQRAMYRDLNILFTELNETMSPPTIEYYKEVIKILVKASKVIYLSPKCNLDPDYCLMKEKLDEFRENKIAKSDEYIRVKGVYIPASYDKIDKDYSTLVQEEIEIPIEYKNKVKKKNRNKTKYKYK